MNSLIQKYDKQGPRYTSYPPVPYWTGAPEVSTWISDVRHNFDKEKGVDIYVHVPYCERLCYYCGCHRVVKKSKSENQVFVDAIVEEWNKYKKEIPEVFAHSIHLGGGTPTFLLPDELDNLLSSIIQNHPLKLGSVEIDPRTTSREHLEVFKKRGLKRISMGIQDFDPVVQKLINREQSFELVSEILRMARDLEFESINFDLIYGLPGQTVEGLLASAEKVSQLSPDMIAFYSYAHLPSKIKNQKLIDESKLPEAMQKHEMHREIRNYFLSQGLIDIGMDHYAKENSPLGFAAKKGKLLRNFMGYTDQKTNVLIGLGPSSISSSSKSFVQNEKDLKGYIETVKTASLPISNGHCHDARDLEIEKIIQSIMCNGNWNHEQLQSQNIAQIENELEEMISDGLVFKQNKSYRVTEYGKFFLRNISMIYDERMREKKIAGLFSRTV